MFKHEFYPIATLIAVLSIFCTKVIGHGMLLDPVSRSSRWRVDSSARANYDDNGLFCGGFSVMWGRNGGKCGLCGDDYSKPTPRPNELGGTYGQGIITKRYVNQFQADLGIRITANHLGFFYFNICNLDEFGEESEACFNKNRVLLADRSDKLYIGSKTGWVNATIILPPGLNCKHCVLRWSYQAGNNWGYCEDGSGATGCGPQENFKGCSDISIIAPRSRNSAVSVELSDTILNSVEDVDDAPIVGNINDALPVEPVDDALTEPVEGSPVKPAGEA
ncbi:uncharacterized protein LOC129941269 [Eupeodes corollae]|uniref:uncharacterized protein LOC129941079 n=1 Tax=Eupeodes corollae TaxID=290404 RepID=UPI0024900653|nr:uncharacterized protein LOC129941079 [Eupeodes corollae]XP_055905830.1 uncharacterized protein LOC129941269 [Eupeodes corollae]